MLNGMAARILWISTFLSSWVHLLHVAVVPKLLNSDTSSEDPLQEQRSHPFLCSVESHLQRASSQVASPVMAAFCLKWWIWQRTKEYFRYWSVNSVWSLLCIRFITRQTWNFWVWYRMKLNNVRYFLDINYSNN